MFGKFRVRTNRRRYYGVWMVASWLVIVGLAFVPIGSVVAQGTVPEEVPTVNTDGSDNSSDAQQEEAPSDPKPESLVPDEPDEAEQRSNSVYLPNLQAPEDDEASAAGVDAPTASWHLVWYEGFNGTWPAGKWSVTDYNGASVGGTRVWNDTTSGHYEGTKSAHSTGGSFYVNNTDTYMVYGPFSLTGATNARVLFRYWLDTEANFDYFTFEYSCNGKTNWNGAFARSGAQLYWAAATWYIQPCVGYTNVYLRFNFKSDASLTDQGVWVDNIRVEKYY